MSGGTVLRGTVAWSAAANVWVREADAVELPPTVVTVPPALVAGAAVDPLLAVVAVLLPLPLLPQAATKAATAMRESTFMVTLRPRRRRLPGGLTLGDILTFVLWLMGDEYLDDAGF
jgi:hypothetical protein